VGITSTNAQHLRIIIIITEKQASPWLPKFVLSPFFSYLFGLYAYFSEVKKSEAIPVTGREGP
jgi:hypothetical protein